MRKQTVFGAAIIAMGLTGTTFAANSNWVDVNTNPAGNSVPSTAPRTNTGLSLGIGFGANDIANPAQSKKAADTQTATQFTPVSRDLLPITPPTAP